MRDVSSGSWVPDLEGNKDYIRFSTIRKRVGSCMSRFSVKYAYTERKTKRPY